MTPEKTTELLPANAIYLAALTQKGPEILFSEPELKLTENEKKELAFKSMPLTGKDGDFVSTNIQSYQAACLVNQVPSFKEAMDDRDTYLSMGLLLDPNTNPIPYKNILQRITAICKEHNLLNYECLKKISAHLYKSISITHEHTFTFEVKKGVKVEFTFLDKFEKWLEKNNKKTEMSTGIENAMYKRVLTLEEALEREKTTFVLDKTILKAICSQDGPVSIDEIRRKTLPLETALGMKIDLPMIEEVLKKYIKQGIIKQVKEQ